MYGLEAIDANNGWAISMVGITIVFTGLVTLATVIAQLYKVLNLWKNLGKTSQFFRSSKKETEKTVGVYVITNAQKETAKQFHLLVRSMEDNFSLSRLLYLSEISGLKDPHSVLTILLKSRIIKPDAEGYFCWDEEVFDRTIAY